MFREPIFNLDEEEQAIEDAVDLSIDNESGEKKVYYLWLDKKTQ
jgi:hypothetical protein